MKLKGFLVLMLVFAVATVWAQGLETFDNFSEGGSYMDGTFAGQDGSTWAYTQCRGDHSITGSSIMIGRNRDTQSNFYSGTISNGIGVLSFDYMQSFSTNVNLKVLVNDVEIAIVTSDNENMVVKNSGDITVNTPGDYVIKFINVNNGDGQVTVDNISWTAYSGPATNHPPVARAGSDQLVFISTTVALDGSASSDPNDNIASYLWTQVSGTGVTLADANAVTTTFTAPGSNADLSFELIVTDSTALTDRDTVNIMVREPQDTKLIISEYIEGDSGNNKAIELFNFTETSVSLDGYSVKLASNGGGWGSEQPLSGTLTAGEVYVIANSSSIQSILDEADTTSTVTYFNGNDAIGLFLNSVLVDVIGVPTEDPGDGLGWEVAGTANATKDHTLIRKPNVESGNTDWASSAGTNADNSEWNVMDANYFSDLGSHTSGPVAYTFSNSVVTTPFPQAGSEISITIDITPDEGVSAPTTVKVYYGTGDTQPNHADMWLESGTTYAGIIPSLTEGNITLNYYVEAVGGTNTVSSALYNMVVAGTVITISDIHDNIVSYDGLTKTIEGVITIGAGVLRDDRTSCYIQDASGRGLNLYDASEVLTDLTRGTRVKLVGEVDLYFTTVEIKDFSYSVVSTGQALPAAQAVSVAGANSDDLEGTLATVTGTLSEVQTFTTSKNLILTEGTDSTIVKVWPTTGINADTLIIGTEYAITGVGSKYSTEHQLLVGYVSDITDEVAICDDCYIPASFSLSAAYPNPFNPNTTLEYSIDQGGVYELSVYNITGQRVSVLASGYAEPGIYKQTWNAGNFTSGVYFIRLEATDKIATRKVVLIK